MIQPIKIIAIFVYRLNEGNPHIPGSLSATLGYHLKSLSIMDNKNNQCKNLEDFLRRNFGLKGEYFSPEYKAAVALKNDDERDAAFDAILEENGPEGYYTKEAWDAWERALNMVDDLVSMGIFDDEPGSPTWDIRHGFCNLSC